MGAAPLSATPRVYWPRTVSLPTAFLQRGIAALAPRVTALHKLNPSSDLESVYATAVGASDRELALLRSTLHGLQAGNDPVVAIKTLQNELGPAEDAAGRAWREVEVPACTQVMG